jgi:hypothetical protein
MRPANIVIAGHRTDVQAAGLVRFVVLTRVASPPMFLDWYNQHSAAWAKGMRERGVPARAETVNGCPVLLWQPKPRYSCSAGLKQDTLFLALGQDLEKELTQSIPPANWADGKAFGLVGAGSVKPFRAAALIKDAKAKGLDAKYDSPPDTGLIFSTVDDIRFSSELIEKGVSFEMKLTFH